MQNLFNVCGNWTFTFKICLLNYPSGQDAGFPMQGPRFKSAVWLQDQDCFSLSSCRLNVD